MSTFLDLRTRAAFLAYKLSGQGIDTTPGPDWSALVNGALTDYSWDSEYHQSQITLTSVMNQAEYPLTTPAWRTIKDVSYGTYALFKTSENEERQADPVWFLRAAAPPNRFYITEANTLRLVDPPNNSGDTITVRGTRCAPPLVADTDSPTMPDTFQEAISLRAAWLYAQVAPGNTIDQSVLDSYLAQYQKYIKDLKGWISQERYGGQLVRHVNRPRRPRVSMRGYSNYYY